MVTLMTLIGLAVGVEYTQECLYSFCHYQTRSITLQASRFQTNSELEQQCHCHCSFFVTLICCMGQVQKYTCTCVSLLLQELVFSYQYLTVCQHHTWPVVYLCRRKSPFYYLHDSDMIASHFWVCCHHCSVQVVYEHLFNVASESVI